MEYKIRIRKVDDNDNVDAKKIINRFEDLRLAEIQRAIKQAEKEMKESIIGPEEEKANFLRIEISKLLEINDKLKSHYTESTNRHERKKRSAIANRQKRNE